VEFVRGLALTHSCHVNSDQLGDFRRNPGRGAVTNLFVVADQQVRGPGRPESGVLQGFHRGEETSNTSLVIQVT
jgi:hypothetical protein